MRTQIVVRESYILYLKYVLVKCIVPLTITTPVIDTRPLTITTPVTDTSH